MVYGGMAELIAGAISMGLGGYLGAKSERSASPHCLHIPLLTTLKRFLQCYPSRDGGFSSEQPRGSGADRPFPLRILRGP